MKAEDIKPWIKKHEELELTESFIDYDLIEEEALLRCLKKQLRY